MNPNNLITTASFTPNSLQFPSAWLGHLPFAWWMIREVTPKIFVELGTYYGHSYFSFCQSVLEAGILTKCYAVDTWQGDEHVGQYNEEVFAKVNAHNLEHYAGFSRLLWMTFDDAVTCFADESIELLHIDGLHTYEAVRHDFETWLPKLAPGAVVMFHDTNVREHDFGVWKLWEELQARYSYNLEFVHSHGLGVLQLNNAPDDKKLEWLQPDSPEKLRLINYFAALGSRQVERFELNELKQYVVNLNQVVAEHDGQIANLSQALNEREGQITSLNQALAEIESSKAWKLVTAIRKIKNTVHKTIGLKGFIIKLIKKVFKLGQNNPMKDFQEIENYFRNKNGLEIGGPSGFFKKNGFLPIYGLITNLDGVNFASSTIWTGTFDEEKGFIIDGKRVGKQYILDAVDLTSIEKSTYDFVLSCNNIEHIANPMKAVEQWLSVLKQGGVLVIVAPRKESNFDHNRKIVKFKHLISDYQNKIKEDDLTHLEEILMLHDLKMDPPAGTIEQFKKRSLENFKNRCLHQHVFDLNLLRKIFEHFNLSIIKSIQLYSDYIIIGQK